MARPKKVVEEKKFVSHTELYTYSMYYVISKILEQEGRKNGNKDNDDMLDMLAQVWRDKLEIMGKMYELETGEIHNLILEYEHLLNK